MTATSENPFRHTRVMWKFFMAWCLAVPLLGLAGGLFESTLLLALCILMSVGVPLVMVTCAVLAVGGDWPAYEARLTGKNK